MAGILKLQPVVREGGAGYRSAGLMLRPRPRWFDSSHLE